MKTFRFLDFPVYQEARQYYFVVIKISEQIKFRSLQSQIRRAALSVILNIAEGSAKFSDKEFRRFLETSIASMNEVVACLDIMRNEKSISDPVYEKMTEKAESIVKQLGGFIRKLRKG